MKTRIDIPNPCSEDWSKMTPTEKGAFCNKCAFEVLDFTDQSPEEIRATLRQRMGQRTCGHISRTQMDLVNTNYHIWENQSMSTFRSKFLYACLIVFGLNLFNGCAGSGEEQVGGETEYKVGDVEVGMVAEDTTVYCDDPALPGMIEFEETEGNTPEVEQVKGKMENKEEN